MEILEMKEIEAALEGILFASGEPVHIDRICLALDLDRPTAELVLQKLGDYYSFERRGIRLVRMADTWQLCSAPEYAEYIRKAFEIRKRPSSPSRRWRCWPSLPTTSPLPGPISIRFGAWTARILWGCCWIGI